MADAAGARNAAADVSGASACQAALTWIARGPLGLASISNSTARRR